MEQWPAGLPAPALFPMFPNYMYNPMVCPPGAFPPGLPGFGPFGPFPGGVHPSMYPFNLSNPGQLLPPQPGAEDNMADVSSHKPDKTEGEPDAELARKSTAAQAGSTAAHAAPLHITNLTESHPSTASLMSLAAASQAGPNAMRSLHSSVTALDALAQGASLEFLQGMTTSMSATMLNALNSSPHHVSPSDQPPNGKVSTLPLSSSFPNLKNMPTPAPGHTGPVLTIMPLMQSGSIPSQDTSTQPSRTLSGRPSRKPGGASQQESPINTTGMTQDQLATATMAQLQSFLHQSQAVMSPRPLPVKIEPQGSVSASRKSQASRPQGHTDASGPMAQRSSIGLSAAAARRGAGSAAGRSSSHPQLSSQAVGMSDAAPSSSRSRNGNPGQANSGGMARISSLQALVEVAAAAADEEDEHPPGNGSGAGEAGVTNGHSSMPCSDSGDPDDMAGLDDKMMGGEDEGEVKRLKRKQSNRESARRSRLKKQAEADALTRATSELQAENAALRAALTASQGLMQKLVQEKAGLVGQVRSMGGEVPPELDWQLPVIRMPTLMGMAP